MYLGRLGESLAVQYPKPSDVYSRLIDLSFANEADRVFYSSYDANRDGMISYAEQNAFLKDQGLPMIALGPQNQPISKPVAPAAQAAPIIPIALLAYLFLS